LSEVRQWLEELGLGQYAEAFEENAVDGRVLPHLTEQDLVNMGVEAVGHRRLMLTSLPPSDATTGDTPQAVGEPVPQDGHRRVPEAERRQITVMFCDLVGSTALSEVMDPEDLRTLMQGYQQACGEVIERYEGHVAQYLGDGLMTYFGWPQAHEDDAERAVRASLEIVEAVKAIDGVSEPLQVRVGIATGPVVVGETGAGDASVPSAAVGETPNVAARVQGLIEPGTVAIAHSTRRLIGGAFALEEMGAQALKGISEAVKVWEVKGESAVETRFEATHQAGLTPLVGRETEIAMLMERWEQAKDGDGQVVLLSGEPGIGKSRIALTLRERIGDEPHTRLRYQCSPYHTNSAYYPIIEQLTRAARFDHDEGMDAKLDKLEILLNQSSDDVAKAAPLFAAMLSLPVDRYPSSYLSPQGQKEATVAALTDQTVALSLQEPVLMIFEDVHWIDPTTLEILERLIDRIQDAAVLLVITCRPEFEARWVGQGHVTLHSLNRLGRRQGADMVAKVTAGIALPVEVLDEIIAKTDGVPLFVEELTKTVLEAGFLKEETGAYVLDAPLPPLAIPATLQDSLMARLDRLASVKEIAQIGACIGRVFSYDLLALSAPLNDNALSDALIQLSNSGLITQRGVAPTATYTFKHALVQDAAYESLLKSRRERLHQKIATVLESDFPNIVKAEPELIAHHYTSAALADRAVPYWLAAGKQAISRSANQEAIRHLRRGLELLPTLPESQERGRLELDIQVALGPPSIAIKGYRSPETIAAYKRAYEISRQLGEREERSAILFGLWVIKNVESEHANALDWADQALAFAAEADNDADLMIARRMHGMTCLHTGHIREAGCDLKKSQAMYDPKLHGGLAFRVAQDPYVGAGVFLSWALWLQGYPDKAQSTADRALESAQSLNHAYTNIWALTYAGVFISLWRGNFERAAQHLSALEEQSVTNGFLLFADYATMLAAWLQVKKRLCDLTNETRAVVDKWDDASIKLFSPLWLSEIAEGHLVFGRSEMGVRTVDEALAFVSRTNERMMEAELLRLKGDCMRALGDSVGAEKELQDAIGIARHQQAKSWELKAATSLARLWQSQSKTAEAYDLLAQVYDWFTEGFDTADLQEAKALLEELN
jgi:predicted ATPase/class 3 adenylate cyclase